MGIFLFLTSIALAQSDLACRYFLTEWEGRSNIPYQSFGLWHCGVGHRLTKADGLPIEVTDKQIEEWFEKDLERTRKAVLKLFPSFYSQPENVKLILISICFTTGENGLSKFVKFRKAIEERDYQRAADELRNSVWFLQVGRRGVHHVEWLTKEAKKS